MSQVGFGGGPVVLLVADLAIAGLVAVIAVIISSLVERRRNR